MQLLHSGVWCWQLLKCSDTLAALWQWVKFTKNTNLIGHVAMQCEQPFFSLRRVWLEAILFDPHYLISLPQYAFPQASLGKNESCVGHYFHSYMTTHSPVVLMTILVAFSRGVVVLVQATGSCLLGILKCDTNNLLHFQKCFALS